MFIHRAFPATFLFFVLLTAIGEEPPVIPIGLDAYRQWDRWACQRIGARAYMRSTYDRRGGNEGADASHFLYQVATNFNVTLDVSGPGILYFARYNHWHGSPWHYEIDGTDHLVEESSTAHPLKPAENSVFLPESVFPSPLAWTWAATKGADLSWVPVPFEKSFRMAYSRTRYGTGYYIFHQYVRGVRLSRPIKSWDAQTPPDADVLNLISRSGTDLAPAALKGVESGAGIVAIEKGPMEIPKEKTVPLFEIQKGPRMLRALEFSVPRDQAIQFGRTRLRITWDDLNHPSIDAPVALFFGTGTLYNRDGREFLVKGFPIHVRFDATRVYLACYFPMPFFEMAKISLEGNGETAIDDVRSSVRVEPYSGPLNHVAYFHATYHDQMNAVSGQDLVVLDTRETEGGGDWSGHFVGTSWIFTDRCVLNTLEGDPRFFFDDSLTPQGQGTGTEEWSGGGDYWGGRNMTLPFAGHPVGARRIEEAKNDEDKIHSAYRFLLADLMPFGRNALIRLEHGGENRSQEHYRTLAYWYGVPIATLIKTDELKIADVASEKAHRYFSPQASEPYEIISRYEWGIDTLPDGREVYPAHADHGRKTTGTSEFTLKLEPKNYGVLLRRKLDYSFPNQRAEVYVAESENPDRAVKESDWKFAGIWYLAGSNTCIYSNPKDELGATEHNVQVSNRRFRDDEFLVPRDLTEGRNTVRFRIKFVPVPIPLFPGQPLPELAWSELNYTAYCWVMPNFPK